LPRYIQLWLRFYCHDTYSYGSGFIATIHTVMAPVLLPRYIQLWLFSGRSQLLLVCPQQNCHFVRRDKPHTLDNVTLVAAGKGVGWVVAVINESSVAHATVLLRCVVCKSGSSALHSNSLSPCTCRIIDDRIITSVVNVDRLCGLVFRVADCRTRGLGFDSRGLSYFLVPVSLERGPLNLLSINEE
jgi:hypothetical protein